VCGGWVGLGPCVSIVGWVGSISCWVWLGWVGWRIMDPRPSLFQPSNTSIYYPSRSTAQQRATYVWTTLKENWGGPTLLGSHGVLNHAPIEKFKATQIPVCTYQKLVLKFSSFLYARDKYKNRIQQQQQQQCIIFLEAKGCDFFTICLSPYLQNSEIMLKTLIY